MDTTLSHDEALRRIQELEEELKDARENPFYELFIKNIASRLGIKGTFKVDYGTYNIETAVERLQWALRNEQRWTRELEASAQEKLNEIANLSDVGQLFDGHDECNEHTHEENAKLMEHALDRIFEIVTAALKIEAATS